VIRYDKPGCGLSDRDGINLSFDGRVTAALAVADAVGVGRFRLFGASQGAQLAAAIAARHPDRVEALVLYGMCASGQPKRTWRTSGASCRCAPARRSPRG
jgi:pimeloyl-ACP methyl ester carboxylesterase